MQDPHVLQVVVVVGCAVIGLTWLAGRLRITPPIVLLLGGVPLAFLPWTADVVLEPTVVLLVFLPALLYWESLTTSLREIRSNLRVVVLSSVLLVLATAALVAVTAHAVLGLSWPVAWVLGAVVAPTDATAMAAVAGRMPRRILTTLRAESLINDGTALVVFALAVSVATGEQVFSWASAIGAFALSYVGGALAGLVVAWLAVRARKLVRAPLSEAAISLLTPFVAFLLAEELHASGVLAVVVCGLTLSQVGPRVIGARTRIQTEAFWRVSTFVLNGTLFVLVGLQLRGAVEGLSSTSVPGAAAQALLVAAVVIGTRLLWINVTPYLIRAIDRRPQQRLRRVGFRQRQPMAWAGFRGGVSLAAALAVPHDVPGRDLIVLVTFGVILVTLVVQGLTLPAVLRWARLTDDGSEAREQAFAERAATEAGLSALAATAERLGIGPEIAERVRADYEEHLHVLTDPTMPAEDPALAAERDQHADDQRLRVALIAEKRAVVVGLRDSRKIDDIVLRRLQSRLDAEEVRLAAPSTDLE